MKSGRFLLIFLLIIIISSSYCAIAQEEAKTKPLELPNFIIEGREQLNIQSGIKQFSEKPTTLTKQELDSINSLEKQQSLLLPQKQLPDKIMSYYSKLGYLKGEFGRFITPILEGGYNFGLDNYRLFANAGVEYSQGHIDNSSYFKGFLDASSEYLAPDKFFIFGGSKTTTRLTIADKSYKLYAMQAPYSRSIANLDFNLNSDGYYEGYDFTTGLDLRTLQLSQTNTNAFDNGFSCHLTVKKLSGNVELGGNGLIDFHSVRGNGVHFLQFGGLLKYYFKDIIFTGNLGFQQAQSSTGDGRTALQLLGQAEYLLNHLFTLKAAFSNNLENNSFYERGLYNPYVCDTSVIDFDIVQKLKLYGQFHPSDRFQLSAGVEYGIGSRTPYFINSDTGSFLLKYDGTKTMSLNVDGYLAISNADNINFNLITNLSSLNNGNDVPYSTSLKVAANYRRLWAENFSSTIGIYYIGERTADLDGKEKLPGFADIKINAEYKFNKDLSVYLNLQNLFNSEIVIWKGYKERSMFFNLGAMWRF